MPRGAKVNAIEQALISARESASDIGDDVLTYMIEVAITHVRTKKAEKVGEYLRLVGQTSQRKAG
jgi:hypothetical protein